jgi:alcohol dehydrogenase class IV
MVAIMLPREIHCGGGSIKSLPHILAKHGFSAPILVVDAFILNSQIGGDILRACSDASIHVRTFSGVVPDPTTSSVDAAAAFIKSDRHDCVIGLGGGSAIDTAKAAAVLSGRGGVMRALKAPHVEDKRWLPIIAIPTTAGTGSEATRFTVVTDDATGEKMLCTGAAYLPDIAIVDYELTLSKPKRLTADTGIDALTHAIEAYVSRKASPFTDHLAMAAMTIIAKNIRCAYSEPGNKQAREAMMLGALNAGIAFSNSSVALVHGMSRPLGAHFHVPHGLSNAMLLPAVTAWSAEAAQDRYRDCAVSMGLVEPGVDAASAVALLVAELTRLNQELEVPTPAQYKIPREDWDRLIPTMAAQALASGSPQNNPRVPNAAEIADLYERVWG